MNNRREFLKTSTLGAAAALLQHNSLIGAPAAKSPQEGRLKKGVLISMLPKQMTYLDRFKLAVDVGFEGVEAQTVEDPKEADQIKEASEKAKIRIHSVMNMGHWQWPFSSLNPDDLKKGAERMEISLRNAKLWGADTVLLVPAVVNPDTTIPQAWKRSQPQIRKLLPLAKELGVVIAIEPVWNKFLLTPYDTSKYVDEFKSPWVKAYFDVGNVVMYGFPQEWIRALGKRIVKFHLKDFKYETRQWVPLREGSIDWKDVRKAIGEIGFSGYLTVELRDGDESYLREVSRRVDTILAGE
ncbi:MAG TPA: TIM barrel protein [Blastocatellia bacterium]|jgi:hexulose-6-phosphate isomerase|nr:TIM barrel protein [Blastocatellia bacterium]